MTMSASSTKPAGSEPKSAPSLSGVTPPDKAAAVLINFLDTIFKEGAHNWSPEEREKRVDACMAEITDIRKAENAQDMEDFSRNLRARIMAGEFDPKAHNEETGTLSSPSRPSHNQELRQAIKEMADSINFD